MQFTKNNWAYGESNPRTFGLKHELPVDLGKTKSFQYHKLSGLHGATNGLLKHHMVSALRWRMSDVSFKNKLPECRNI